MKTYGILWLLGSISLLTACQAAAKQADPTVLINACQRAGWEATTLQVAGLQRSILWKLPNETWPRGAIIVLHGGGGSHYHFCSGGRLVQPQIEFARLAISQGFAVFLLDSTHDVVTDAAGRRCGKRFDFSVLERPNIDLPFIEAVINRFIPTKRPVGSSEKIFLTGLSTGGYMTIRAATQFDDKITAFAPVSAGDPYGTEINCDADLSPRKSAKGILTDLESGRNISTVGACAAEVYRHEKPWPVSQVPQKPPFRQFHHQGDAIVDLSCMEKVRQQLVNHGYPDAGAFILESSRRKIWHHLWLKRYNQPILDFFKSQ